MRERVHVYMCVRVCDDVGRALRRIVMGLFCLKPFSEKRHYEDNINDTYPQNRECLIACGKLL